MVPVKGERSCNDGLASENSYRYRQPCRQIAAAKHAAFTELLFFFSSPHTHFLALLVLLLHQEALCVPRFLRILPKTLALLCFAVLFQPSLARLREGPTRCSNLLLS